MAFSEATVKNVWHKGRAMSDRDPIEWRKDECGAWMRSDQYGSETSEFGWKIVNVSPGGPDELENLRPFHRENSFNRGSGKTRCKVTADRQDLPPGAHIDIPSNREF